MTTGVPGSTDAADMAGYTGTTIAQGGDHHHDGIEDEVDLEDQRRKLAPGDIPPLGPNTVEPAALHQKQWGPLRNPLYNKLPSKVKWSALVVGAIFFIVASPAGPGLSQFLGVSLLGVGAVHLARVHRKQWQEHLAARREAKLQQATHQAERDAQGAELDGAPTPQVTAPDTLAPTQQVPAVPAVTAPTPTVGATRPAVPQLTAAAQAEQAYYNTILREITETPKLREIKMLAHAAVMQFKGDNKLGTEGQAYRDILERIGDSKTTRIDVAQSLADAVLASYPGKAVSRGKATTPDRGAAPERTTVPRRAVLAPTRRDADFARPIAETLAL